MKTRVGYLGQVGTFSEIAVLSYFHDDEAERIGMKSFREMLEALENKELDYAVLPVENTTTGIISRTYDLLKSYEVFAVGEAVIQIAEDLIVLPGTKIEEIRTVYSHPEALSQCSGFFEAHPTIRQVPYNDTAKSAEHVKNSNDRSIAALGSWRAREAYGLESLLQGVQNLKNNMTRFLIVSNKRIVQPEADKVSLMMVLRHKPGTLYNILGILAKNGVNVLKLESRPIQEHPFEYFFYIDFEGNTETRLTQEILKEMGQRCTEMRVLGCYKAVRI